MIIPNTLQNQVIFYVHHKKMKRQIVCMLHWQIIELNQKFIKKLTKQSLPSFQQTKRATSTNLGVMVSLGLQKPAPVLFIVHFWYAKSGYIIREFQIDVG